MLVSVIIPVYKVEDYIEKCIQSLLNQTYANFEALIIDDGSPDDSISLAKNLVGNDLRFIFFKKENGGQGTARNLGLDHVKGEYIAFLDSDDYYDKDYLSIMVKKITEDNADICVCNVRNVDTSGKQISIRKNNVSLYLKHKDHLATYNYISNYMWDKLFKANCFEDLRFDENIRTYEDVHILFKVLYNKDITSVDEVLYDYVQRPGSTVNSLPKTYIDDRHNIYLEVLKFHKERLESEKSYERHLMHHFLHNFIYSCSMNIVRYSDNYERDITNLLSKDTTHLFKFKNIVKSRDLSKKSKLALITLKSNPKVYKALMIKWLNTRYKEDIK